MDLRNLFRRLMSTSSKADKFHKKNVALYETSLREAEKRILKSNLPPEEKLRRLKEIEREKKMIEEVK